MTFIDRDIRIVPRSEQSPELVDRSNCQFCYWSQAHWGWQHNNSMADMDYPISTVSSAYTGLDAV